MENRRRSAIVLILIGLVGVNFFYVSDLVIPHSPDAGIVIGWNSAVAIGVANLLALAGVWHVTRDAPRD